MNIKLCFFFIAFSLIFFGCTVVKQYDSETQKKLEECDKKDQFWKDTCFSLVAQDINDLTICDKITTQPTYDLCYISVAINLEDPTICEKLSDQASKDYCYDEFAIQLNQPELCDKIQNPDVLESCQNLASNNK
jgi:hypothetical protein